MTRGVGKRSLRETSKNGNVYSMPNWEEWRLQGPVVQVPISSLLSADSPRLTGEDLEHVRVLAESDVTFPPIVINPSTMRVIDGMHRLRAAELRGQDQIQVRFLEGDERDSFVFAVRQNIAHGLPLSLADRTAAAARIIDSHPEWSDRAIAATVGLAAKTVGAIRQRSTGQNSQLNGRVGRDGKVRPRSTAEGRIAASKLLTSKPNAPLREVASVAGISLGTAQNVRARLRRGESPVLRQQRAPEQRRSVSVAKEPAERRESTSDTGAPTTDRALFLQNLRRNPDIRFIGAGRTLISLLQELAVDKQEWDQLINDIPQHCIPVVSAAARACAQTWQEFANRLEHR